VKKSKPKKPRKRSASKRDDTTISLAPMSVEDAVSELLKAKPPVKTSGKKTLTNTD
jgi:hypothetical protein